jgi:hypothetical protein
VTVKREAGETVLSRYDVQPAIDIYGAVTTAVERGKKINFRRIVVWHGVQGRGNGPAAGGLSPGPDNHCEAKKDVFSAVPWFVPRPCRALREGTERAAREAYRGGPLRGPLSVLEGRPCQSAPSPGFFTPAEAIQCGCRFPAYRASVASSSAVHGRFVVRSDERAMPS